MNRSPFAIAQRTQDLPQNDMLAQCPFCSIVGWLHPWVNDKCKPELEAIVDLANELSHFLTIVFCHGPFLELCLRFEPKFPADFWWWIVFYGSSQFFKETLECLI